MIYTSVESNDFTKTLDGLRVEYPRIDDVWRAITWDLGRAPLSGSPLQSDSAYRVYKTTQIGATPSFRVLYKADANKGEITLIAIDALPIEANGS
ncbi:MAG: hypothetical protein GX604_08860 [Actinobacteria bacterium]|nr:hypothetical protein [Actinomycetota bacterium]